MSSARNEPEWRWFGNSGHFICGFDCRFHLCTLVGDVLVSTVGQYFPDESSREILAESKGITLKGRGDARRNDFMKKCGYQEIGCDRTFETMAFATSGAVCTEDGCDCGLPEIIPNELAADGYNTAGAATRGHYEMCRRAAAGTLEA